MGNFQPDKKRLALLTVGFRLEGLALLSYKRKHFLIEKCIFAGGILPGRAIARVGLI